MAGLPAKLKDISFFEKKSIASVKAAWKVNLQI